MTIKELKEFLRNLDDNAQVIHVAYSSKKLNVTISDEDNVVRNFYHDFSESDKRSTQFKFVED